MFRSFFYKKSQLVDKWRINNAYLFHALNIKNISKNRASGRVSSHFFGSSFCINHLPIVSVTAESSLGECAPENDKLRPLRPLRPLRRSGRPIVVILSGAQRSRRISLKSLPLVAASRDHSTTPRYPYLLSLIKAKGRTQNTQATHKQQHHPTPPHHPLKA